MKDLIRSQGASDTPMQNLNASLAPEDSYPEGTNIGDIRYFRRSIKVAFTCKRHDIGIWVSKDPFISTWFPHWTNVTPEGNAKHDANICDCPTGSLVTTHVYPKGPAR